MEKVYTNGKMVECITETIKMIRKMDLGFMSGLMEEPTWANGQMENKMERESIFYLMAQ
jgi:hypothetical protein